MPRPKRQDARRASIIAAAGRAIRTRGLAGLRIRDIAEEAGLSAGSVLYYYPETADLLIEVHRTTVNDFYQSRLDRTSSAADPQQRLVATVRSGLPSGPDDHTCRTLYEMHALADGSASHAALMSSLFDREVMLYRSVLDVGAGLGVFDLSRPVDEIARNAVVLEDGYGLHVMSRTSSVTAETARQHILGYLAAVTGVPGLVAE
ncbi:TetR/AcrR family transcriptional regulator [Saccharopolyspora rosea]|uniref:TetR/AcrR family transcriptional regulator n=1 Tax=Saccharopolyspora rosea TaxID=524884 RepID=A0ABW3FM41_9PSEU|nr:TetR/AcrR family transcriptional regulator [Saccharopolyspora rosea]